MQDQLNQIKAEFILYLENVSDLKSLEEARVAFLGKKGRFTAIMKSMGKLSKEERPVMGKLANEVRESIELGLKEKREKLEKAVMEAALHAETLDVTLTGKKNHIGGIHPLSTVIQEMEDIFLGMGFSIAEGPEIEWVRYNFDYLNMPQEHSARDPQETFYYNDETVLRTQTSPVQVRVMMDRKPPLRIISPGRVYRCDEIDATHSPVFHQMEGLVIDKGITMADLKGTLDLFAKRLFGENVQTKLRPHQFYFTEPSAEMDVTCFKCGGKGCRVCGDSGWIELLGCGMVHPNVLRHCGIDPEVYSGFAFGIGLDRTTEIKYGINDLRLLFENDVRFLSQFK